MIMILIFCGTQLLRPLKRLSKLQQTTSYFLKKNIFRKKNKVWRFKWNEISNLIFSEKNKYENKIQMSSAAVEKQTSFTICILWFVHRDFVFLFRLLRQANKCKMDGLIKS